MFLICHLYKQSLSYLLNAEASKRLNHLSSRVRVTIYNHVLNCMMLSITHQILNQEKYDEVCCAASIENRYFMQCA